MRRTGWLASLGTGGRHASESVVGLARCTHRFYRDFYQWDELGEILRLCTGLQLDKSGLQRVARTVTDQVRRFNLREGLTAAHDWLPDRFFDEPLPETGAVLHREELERMRSDYYRLRGWTAEGIPPVGGSER